MPTKTHQEGSYASLYVMSAILNMLEKNGGLDRAALYQAVSAELAAQPALGSCDIDRALSGFFDQCLAVLADEKLVIAALQPHGLTRYAAASGAPEEPAPKARSFSRFRHLARSAAKFILV